MRKETEELKINMSQWPGIYPDLNHIVNLGCKATGRFGKM